MRWSAATSDDMRGVRNFSLSCPAMRCHAMPGHSAGAYSRAPAYRSTPVTLLEEAAGHGTTARHATDDYPTRYTMQPNGNPQVLAHADFYLLLIFMMRMEINALLYPGRWPVRLVDSRTAAARSRLRQSCLRISRLDCWPSAACSTRTSSERRMSAAAHRRCGGGCWRH